MAVKKSYTVHLRSKCTYTNTADNKLLVLLQYKNIIINWEQWDLDSGVDGYFVATDLLAIIQYMN